MAKVSEAVRALIVQNPALHFGLHHRLLNLSQVARFLRPLVAARVRKEVTPSAILMGLSRLQQSLPALPSPATGLFYIDRINIHAGLRSLTVLKSPQAHREANRLYNRVQKAGGYITITESNSEITVILEAAHWPLVQATITTPPQEVHRELAGLGVKFKAQYTEEPGLLYQILQQLALQHINVVEIASTMTEFNIYLHDDDLMLAFDSLYQRFARGEARLGRAGP